MRVLVTDGDSRPALAAVRALGRRGHEVIVAGERHPCLASVSKHAATFERVPSPVTDAPGFEAALIELVQRRRVEVALPITEVSTLLVTENQERLPSFCRVPFPQPAVVGNAANKAHVIRLAERLGVPVPRGLIVESADEGVRRAAELPYPVVVKPARSRVRAGSGWISTGVRYAVDASDLERILRSLPRETYPVLLQERIPGPGVGLFACFDDGHPTALFAHRRLREKPPSGGVSVLCESSQLDPAAVEYSQLLLSELGWRGVAMVEFKRDDRDGQLRLMEINGRFWGSLELAIAAGVDFPSLALDVATGVRRSPQSAYRIGLRTRWLAGDLDALLMILKRDREQLQLPASHPGRLRVLWDWLHLWGRDLHYEIESFDDPAPARLEWRRRLLGR
jgi:predicted ATP-grasp superfamily ATP-dependent carboligase